VGFFIVYFDSSDPIIVNAGAWRMTGADYVIGTSNGTASVNHYLKILGLIDNLSISLHSEYINEQKFFNKIIDIKNSLPLGKFLHVNIMNEPWNKVRIAYYENILKDHDIYYTVNDILYPTHLKLIPIFKGDLNFDLSKSHKSQLQNNS
jgi:hypothetical protein